MSGIFDGVLGRGGAAREVTGHAWSVALLDVEAALARACAATGLIPAAAAAEIVAVCTGVAKAVGDADVAALAGAAAAAGNPVVPLVAVLRDLVGPELAGHVHLGATSQDILDTALVLVARRAGRWILADLAAGADAAAAHAATHRSTPQLGRTLLQQAAPTTFGLKASGWALALDDAHDRLAAALAELPVQLGGAVGTLAAYGDAAERMPAELARLLDLPETPLPWHTARAPVAALATALGLAAGAVGKIGLDVCLLAQDEAGEVAEGVAGRGGSSAMAHKHNPVAAVSARAASIRTPGLVATMLAAMAQEHERGAGAWHAEWETLADLLRATGSAAAWIADCLTHLQIHSDRMAANLAAFADGVDAGPPETAARLVDRALTARASRENP
jgi:3-carboxy-cis,cis-muconate cycloisomerase